MFKSSCAAPPPPPPRVAASDTPSLPPSPTEGGTHWSTTPAANGARRAWARAVKPSARASGRVNPVVVCPSPFTHPCRTKEVRAVAVVPQGPCFATLTTALPTSNHPPKRSLPGASRMAWVRNRPSTSFAGVEGPGRSKCRADFTRVREADARAAVEVLLLEP